MCKWRVDMVKRSPVVYFVITLVLLLLLVPGSGCTHDVLLGKIAFVSDRGGAPFIYVMAPDGSNQTKLGGWYGMANTFCWSPAGERIAFINEDGWLCLVDADGGNLVKLVEIAGYSLSWSPDGGKIAVGGLDLDLYTIDVGTGKLENITSTPDVMESLPSWSPDSDNIAFIVFAPPSCDIALMNAAGGKQTVIASERGICEEIAWSPDGEKVSYVWHSEEELGPEGICRDICLVNTRDGSKLNLTDSPTFDDRDLSWSPDSTKIAFSSRRQVVETQIYVMNSDGSLLSALTAGDSSNYFPSWSPDGKQIAFTSSGPQLAGEDICIMNADGSNVVNLTRVTDIDGYLPVWSPQ